MIPIPEKDESICYYVPTSTYDTDNIPYDQIQDYLPAAFIGKAFGDNKSAEFHDEELAIFNKTVNAIESGELKADYIENFDPDRIRPDWNERIIRYHTDSSTEYFMNMYTEIIYISNINGHIEISGPVDYRGYLYKNKWYFIYVNTDVQGQHIFPILMDIDADSATIDDIAKIMLDTLPKAHPDTGEFF